MYHGQDQQKGMMIMQMQQQAQQLGDEEEPPKDYLLNKEQCMKYFAVQQ
eukprot:CAMPEP_0168624850 /NCGR_PEP_ID=MMETSP0449_2-20121227/9660_1 /TAXON_ID=1082188 /ORGANISM="Strombidium rassoulzadegani, Strain ras09" /LENGTH=48 /DNA_ID= /DNA_START= /DNA_END= /DNA_ORIENTATION=